MSILRNENATREFKKEGIYFDAQTDQLVDGVLKHIPIPFLIVKPNREVVYTNDQLLHSLDINSLDSILGLKPGDIFQCSHAVHKPGSCGTLKNCNFCGIKNSIDSCVRKNEKIEAETKMIIHQNNQDVYLDFQVNTKPIRINNTELVMVSLVDFSQVKRKEQLERTFYHDLLNKASSIEGLSELLQMKTDKHPDEIIKMMQRGVKELIDEIIFQRNFTYAEKGILAVNYKQLDSITVLKLIKENFLSHEKKSNKDIIIDDNSEKTTFECDRVLIDRILINLVKNSLEAIKNGQQTHIGCFTKKETIVFYVKNDIQLSDEVKALLFHRSFSTKGVGRGIGTYSVKLFTESVLNGKVWFESNEEKGTIFYVELPLKKPN